MEDFIEKIIVPLRKLVYKCDEVVKFDGDTEDDFDAFSFQYEDSELTLYIFKKDHTLDIYYVLIDEEDENKAVIALDFVLGGEDEQPIGEVRLNGEDDLFNTVVGFFRDRNQEVS